MFKAIKTPKYLNAPDHSKPSAAYLESLMEASNSGRTTGKPSIAMSEKLLLTLDAMAAIMVNATASPVQPNSKEVKNSVLF